MDQYQNITLKVTPPVAPTLTLNNGAPLSGSSNFNSVPLAIAKDAGDTDVIQMLVYGYKGEKTKTFTGDGTTTTFKYADDSDVSLDNLSDVASYLNTTVNGTTSSDASDSELTGIVTFTTAPADGDVVVVHFVKKELGITDVTWEIFSASKTLAFDRETAVSDGSVTVSVKLRDDVWNESSPGTATVVVDVSNPTVDVQSVTMGDGTYSTTPTNKISEVAGRDTITIVFQVSEACVEWKAKVVAATGATEDSGTAIGTTYGSVTSGTNIAAETDVSCIIKGSDYKAAVTNDGTYIVKIFAKDSNGNWSI